MLNEKVPGGIIDHGVQVVRVEGQCVVIVKAVDVHLLQADLVVGVDGGGVEDATGSRRNQFCSSQSG